MKVTTEMAMAVRATTIIVMLLLLSSSLYAREDASESNVWTETYSVNDDHPLVVISNIWGSVRVRAGEPGQIKVTVDENRSAPSRESLERSLETLRLHINADSSSLSMVVGEPDRNWRRMDRCRGCRLDLQFDVFVPPGSEIDVSTVMDGRVSVEGITGRVAASNVNGPVSVAGIHDCSLVESVNGAVELQFSRAPNEDCGIETINGDITVGLPAGAGLDVALDQFNGRTTSEFDVDALAIPARVEQTTQDGRYTYRIEQPAGIRLGAGGPTFTLTSLNGDIQIKENQ